MRKDNYLVISNRRVENAVYFETPDDLYDFLERKENWDIHTLIFAFWSWIVPSRLLNNYKCYGLHTGPLLEGKGRGGSPIDNLKALGVHWTTLCAFEMTEKIDEGKVKVAIPICLDWDKDWLIECIDFVLPNIVAYLTAKQPDIPEYFKRLPNVK